MEQLDSIQDKNLLLKYKNDFIDTLKFSEKILGEKHHFSKSISDNKKNNHLNHSIFDVLTVSFSSITNKEKNLILFKRDNFKSKFIDLLLDEESVFYNSITKGTSTKSAITTRFKIIDELIKEVLNEN